MTMLKRGIMIFAIAVGGLMAFETTQVEASPYGWGRSSYRSNYYYRGPSRYRSYRPSYRPYYRSYTPYRSYRYSPYRGYGYYRGYGW